MLIFFQYSCNFIIDLKKSVLKLKFFLIDPFWATVRIKVCWPVSHLHNHTRVTICKTEFRSQVAGRTVNMWKKQINLVETLARYGWTPNFPFKFLILLLLKNNGRGKLYTHMKEHFDNYSYFEIFRKLTGKLLIRLLVYKCL